MKKVFDSVNPLFSSQVQEVDAAWMNMTGVLVSTLTQSGTMDERGIEIFTVAYQRLEQMRAKAGLAPLDEVAWMNSLLQ